MKTIIDAITQLCVQHHPGDSATIIGKPADIVDLSSVTLDRTASLGFTFSDAQTVLAELQAADAAQAYARSRKAEYAPWEEQLDHIYHNGIESWKANMVKPVKDKYPKPG